MIGIVKKLPPENAKCAATVLHEGELKIAQFGFDEVKKIQRFHNERFMVKKIQRDQVSVSTIFQQYGRL